MGRTKVNTNGRRRKPTGPAPDDIDAPDPEGDEPMEASARGPDDDGDIEVEMDAGDTDNVGEQSVEINVQDLLARLEAESGDPDKASACARRRLEDYLEEKRVARALQDMDDFDI